MPRLDDLEGYVRKRILEDKWTHEEVSRELKTSYPNDPGLSVRSVKRFCQIHDIHRTARLTEDVVKEAVTVGVAMVGPTYGRKTMCGLLASEGLKVSETRVGQALQTVRPDYHHMRVTKTTQSLNPRPYRAEYFGQKLHIDQNEKLVMFGVTHICAIDGYSGKIVGFERGEFDLDSTMHKYCVSWITLNVSAVGIRQYTASWNCHYIPGKGIPNDRASKSHAMKLPAAIVPEYDTAVSQFESMGGHLTHRDSDVLFLTHHMLNNTSSRNGTCPLQC
ncbi:hypothetical protein EMCRGX_G021702 [Ephydatia muelleri]